jgi:hypothetical protein
VRSEWGEGKAKHTRHGGKGHSLTVLCLIFVVLTLIPRKSACGVRSTLRRRAIRFQTYARAAAAQRRVVRCSLEQRTISMRDKAGGNKFVHVSGLYGKLQIRHALPQFKHLFGRFIGYQHGASTGK